MGQFYPTRGQSNLIKVNQTFEKIRTPRSRPWAQFASKLSRLSDSKFDSWNLIILWSLEFGGWCLELSLPLVNPL